MINKVFKKVKKTARFSGKSAASASSTSDSFSIDRLRYDPVASITCNSAKSNETALCFLLLLSARNENYT